MLILLRPLFVPSSRTENIFFKMKVSSIENHIDEQSSHIQLIVSAASNLMSVDASNVSSHRIDTHRIALNKE